MARQRPEPTPGLLVVDKPAGWTSHDVVAKCRGILRTSKVGHAGTLDPMATGVLVLGVGKATKLLTYLSGADKDYTATIRLGQATVTDDTEGDVTATADAAAVTDDRIAEAVAALTGAIMQAPSAVSAIKVDGQRAYKRVRDGEDVALAKRPVTVARFAVTQVRRVRAEDGATLVDVDAEVTVSSGTYVRALARDLGAALGVGGHLTALRRTRVGGYALDRARTLEQLQEERESADEVSLLPLATAAQRLLPVVELSAADERALAYGQFIDAPAGHAAAGPAAAITADGRLAAVVEPRGGQLKPVVVLQARADAPE